MSDRRRSTYLPQDPREKLALVGLCAAGLFVFGGDLWKVIGRARDTLRHEVRENMPIDLEIERARALAASLVPDLRRNHEVIVREQVEVEELRTDIRDSRQQLQEQREQLLALRSRLTVTPASLTADSRTSDGVKPAGGEIRRELKQRFAEFQSAEATLAAMTQMLQFREEALGKAQVAQNEMLQKKRALEGQVMQLATRVKVIRRDGVDTHVTVDREKLARCEELLRYLRKRLTIAERVADFSEQGLAETSSAEKEPLEDSIEAEIDRHFEQNRSYGCIGGIRNSRVKIIESRWREVNYK